MPFATEERIQIVKWVLSGNSYRNTKELFRRKYPERPIPSCSTISHVVKKFSETGSVLNRKHNRMCTVVTEENRTNTQAFVEVNPHSSIRQLSAEVNLGTSSVYKILKTGRYHPYKIINLHELNEDDPDRRSEFCEWAMNTSTRDNQFFSRVCFSDEATFSLHGEVNRHNCRYWATENPHWMHETHTQNPQKMNLWAGLLGDHIIGPFVIDGFLTGEKYLQLLQEDVGPEIENLAFDREI